MARERFDETKKVPLTKEALKKFFGIFRFVLPYKTAFILGLIALVFSSLTALAFPFMAGKLLDAAQGNSNFFLSTINQVGFGFLVIILVQGTFSYLRVHFFSRFTEGSIADLRHTVYQKMIWLPQSFFDKSRVGELMSRITSDVATVSDAFTFMLAELLRQVVVLIGGVVILVFLTPRLTLFMLLTFPLLVVAALLFGKAIRKMSRKTQDQLAASNVIVEETLHSISVVKSFTSEMFEVNRYRKALTDLISIALRTAKYRGLFISFIIVSMFGGIVAVAWFGAYLVQNHVMSVGDLMSFVFYTAFVGASIAGLGDLYGQLQKSIGASERILEILDLEDEKGNTDLELKLKGEISFNNVSFKYPTREDVTVLKNMSFNIAPGEKVALVGPSGSGKSTIINLLMRFYDPTNGAVMIDGTNAKNYPLTAFRKNIGIVPQEVILFGGTIRENIAYGKPNSSEEDIIAAAKKANAWQFIETFPEGLDTLVGDRGVKLSGGQRQRVAIARAILKDPSILILDEATSSLDAASERLVQEALETLMENRTTIVIAHRLSTIRKVDRIMVIKDGEIAESGTHAQLNSLNDGIYSNLLRMQLEVTE